uniref:PAT complex subunit CCDC47 n=1 Tax=Romanomermis culicivorax TaxID=13658 RepID=A0A915I2C1_ROMCU
DELDDEEFTTTSKNDEDFDKKSKSGKKLNVDDAQAPKQLKITDVPAHLRNNWSNFQMELLMLLALAVYLINYALGKAKNHKLATVWFENSRDILYSNFEVTVRFTLNNDDLDCCVFCLGKKKSLNKLVKDMTDLSQFCTEKKNMDRLGLPDDFTLYAETAEVTSSIIDSKTLPILQKYDDLIDYIHVSDQYSGLKVAEGETQSKLPETCRVVIFQFNVPGRLSANEKSMVDLKPLLSFTFYCLDKIRRFRLSRE